MIRYRLAVWQAAVLLALAGCSGEDGRAPPRDPTLFAILTDGRLVSATPHRVTEAVRLTRAPLKPVSQRLIAVTPGRRFLAVLLTKEGAGRDEVVILTARGLRVHARVSLHGGGDTTAAALVAPARDRLVAVGDRRTPAGDRLPTGWVIAVPSARLDERWTFPRGRRRTAPVIDAAAAADGERLYLSYHGGVDAISWGSGRSACQGRRDDAAVCIAEIHGEVAAVPGGVVGTGADDQTLMKATPDGQIVDRWPTRLAGNHLMRFAYEPAEGWAFALGSCQYTGGLARVDLAGGLRWSRGMTPESGPTLCGERSAATGRFVALTRGPEFEGASESEVTFVDSQTGSVRARVTIPAPAADLVLLP